MTVTLAGALLINVITIVVLRHRLGRRWLRHPVTLLVLISVIHQGLSPLIMSVPSIAAQDPFRLGISQEFSDDATFLLSACTLALTIAYLLTRPQRAEFNVSQSDVRTLARVLECRRRYLPIRAVGTTTSSSQEQVPSRSQ
jgi:hypothetical protein